MFYDDCAEYSDKMIVKKKLTCLEMGGYCRNYYSANDVVDEFGNVL